MHIERFARYVALVYGWANFDAQTTSGAIFHRNLNRVQLFFKLPPFRRHFLEFRWCARQCRLINDFRPYRRVRAYKYALSALYAQIRLPDSHFQSDISLLPLGRPDRVSAIGWKRTHRERVTPSSDHCCGDILHKIGRLRRNSWSEIKIACNARGQRYFAKMINSSVNRFVILLYYRFSAIAVAFLNGLFDFFNCFVFRQDATYREEASLHDRVNSGSHTCLARHFISIDHIKLELLRDDHSLDGTWQVIPNVLCGVRTVQQESSAAFCHIQHIVPLEKIELMHGDEVGALYQ